MTAVFPVRLRLSRAAGFNLQRLSRETNGLEAVNVARRTRWGNPFHWENGVELLGEYGARAHVVSLFRALITRGFVHATDEAELDSYYQGEPPPPVLLIVKELRGKNLACWCKPGLPCHADFLLEIANL
jgi:hypothetical protein